MVDMPPLEEITRVIVEKFNPRRVILFGSRARGDHREDSDLDLFVEMESNQRPADRRIAVSRALTPRGWPLDVIVYTPEEVALDSGKPGSILVDIEVEGRLLYER
jgi:predicted nucleotidyltransferase